MKYLLLLLPLYIFALPPSVFIARTLALQDESYRKVFYPNTKSIYFGSTITEKESQLLEYRLNYIHESLSKYKWYTDLNPLRKAVLQNIAFNFGISSLFEFNTTIYYLKKHSYQLAAKSMKDTHWYRTEFQAKHLVKLMRDGK